MVVVVVVEGSITISIIGRAATLAFAFTKRSPEFAFAFAKASAELAFAEAPLAFAFAKPAELSAFAVVAFAFISTTGLASWLWLHNGRWGTPVLQPQRLFFV